MLAIYHAKADMTGSALRIFLHNALSACSGDNTGYYELELAPQCDKGKSVYPRFDWDARIGVHIRAFDAAEIISVLRGCEESLEDGKGIFIATVEERVVMRLRHVFEPKPGYVLELTRKDAHGVLEDLTLRIFLSHTEASAILMAMESTFGKLCFLDA